MRRSVCLCVLALHSAHTDYGLFDVFGILLTVGRTELECSLESMNTGQTLENQQDRSSCSTKAIPSGTNTNSYSLTKYS